MSGPLRVGWVGCGVHATEMLLPQLVRLDVRLAALCDLDPGRLSAVASRYGVRPEDTTPDWQALLTRPDLDAVGVAAGPDTHLAVGLAALDRRLPLFLEKPPARTARDAEALADKAAATGSPAVVGFMKRYATANRIAANVIRSADFGPTASFLGEYMTAPTYFATDPDSTGFFLHHCVHYMDLVPFLMGEVAEVSARRHDLAPGKLLLHVDFRFAGGALGTLIMGTHQSRGTPMEWWQVMGDHRRVEVRNVHEVRFHRAPPFKAGRADADLRDGEDTLIWEPNLTAAANEDHKGYHALLADFVAVARGGKRDAPTLADGARAMRLLERITAPVPEPPRMNELRHREPNGVRISPRRRNGGDRVR